MVFSRPLLAAGALLVLAVVARPSQAGERVVVEGAPISVEVPAGWSQMPMSSDPPMLMLVACDPQVRDGCLQRGEIHVMKLRPDQAPASLDAMLAAASRDFDAADPKSRIAPPARLQVAGREAVGAVSVGPVIYDHADGGASTATLANLALTLQDGDTFYRCSGSATPELISVVRADVFNVCNSIQFTGSSSQSGKQ